MERPGLIVRVFAGLKDLKRFLLLVQRETRIGRKCIIDLFKWAVLLQMYIFGFQGIAAAVHQKRPKSAEGVHLQLDQSQFNITVAVCYIGIFLEQK
jgi:hypothetical protein